MASDSLDDGQISDEDYLDVDKAEADLREVIQTTIANISLFSDQKLVQNDPQIQAATTNIVYECNKNTNFGDRDAFILANAKIKEEAKHQADLNLLLEEGMQFASMLYTWRSCTNAIPPESDTDSKEEIAAKWGKIYEVLNEECKKLIDFYDFLLSVSEMFKQELMLIVTKKYVSDTYLLTMGRFINMIVIVNALLTSKASIANDFSSYKRAEKHFKKGLNINPNSVKISHYFGTRNKILNELRDAVEERFLQVHDVFCEIINHFLERFENNIYLLPNERFQFVTIICYSLVLLDGKNGHLDKLFEGKKLNLSRIDKVLKQVSVVPLYGDMSMELKIVVTALPTFEMFRNKWTFVQTNDVRSENVLQNKLNEFESQYEEVLTELASLQNSTHFTKLDLKEVKFAKKETDEKNEEIYTLALNTLRILSQMTCTIIETYSWKLIHPPSKYDVIQMSDDTCDYAKATKYNYSAAEKTAIIRLIGMIKGLQALACSLKDVISKAIFSYIYKEIQKLIQITLREPLRYVVKNKKTNVETILSSLRTCAVDWPNGKPPMDDPLFKHEKQLKKNYIPEIPEIKNKLVPPSSTQIYLVRTMLSSLINDNTNPLTKAKDLKKELVGRGLESINSFLKTSIFWPYMIEFDEIIVKCCDLSQLWFREYFLETTNSMNRGPNSKVVQFDIEFSLSWIFIKHILESNDTCLLEYLFYLFDLYNDSADYALNKFKQQYLYNEIEGETDLVIDQFIVYISSDIFKFYRKLAVQKVAIELGLQNPSERKPIYQTKYLSILQQKSFCILGRKLSLNKLIGSHVLTHISTAMNLAIKRFESCNIDGLIEYCVLKDINKYTFKSLQDIFEEFPDYEQYYSEIDESVNSPHGRFLIQLLSLMDKDFFSNYKYKISSKSFTLEKNVIRRTLAPSDDHYVYLFVTKDSYRKFLKYFQEFEGTIDSNHYEIIAHMIGVDGITMLMKIILEIIKDVTRVLWANDCENVYKKLPYKKETISSCVELAPDPLSNPRKLLPPMLLNFFHFIGTFKIIGNALALALNIEEHYFIKENLELHMAYPFTLTPKQASDLNNQESVISQFINKWRCFNLANSLKIIKNTEFSEQASTACGLSIKKLCSQKSFFGYLLQELSVFLQNEETEVWFNIIRDTLEKQRLEDLQSGSISGQTSANDYCPFAGFPQFYRLWSFFQYTMVLDRNNTPAAHENTYGNGYILGGIAFIVALKQIHQFEIGDMCYFLESRFESVSAKSAPEKQRFLSNLSYFKNINKKCINILTMYIDPQKSEEQQKFLRPDRQDLAPFH